MKGFIGALFVLALWTAACIYYVGISEPKGSILLNKISDVESEGQDIDPLQTSKTETNRFIEDSLQINSDTTTLADTAEYQIDNLQATKITKGESKLLADELMKSIAISDTIDIERDEPEVTLESNIAIEATAEDINRNFYPTYRNANLIIDRDLVNYVPELRKIIKNDPSAKISIIGHTDNIGSAKDNFDIGLKKARQVKWYLTVRRGLPRNKIKATSRGEKEPIESNKSKRGRKKNNRVQIIVK